MGQDLRKPSLYEEDVYSWSLRQAELIRAGRFENMDTENIAEGIATVFFFGGTRVAAFQVGRVSLR